MSACRCVDVGDDTNPESVRARIKLCAILAERNMEQAHTLRAVGDHWGASVNGDLASLFSLHAFELSEGLRA